jgi:putative transcriptional regulator
MKTLMGRFLIATPDIDDLRFKQAVMFVCEHTKFGAMALAINRPASIEFSDIISDFEITINNSKINKIPVVKGGPVQPEMGCVIHPANSVWRSTFNLGEINVTTSKDILRALAEQAVTAPAMVTLGYARWQAQQLEQELAEYQWLTTQADADIIFELPAEQRWHAALATLGITPSNFNLQVGHA